MASRMLLASSAVSYFRASAFHRAFSCAMPRTIEEDKIAAEMKALFEENSVKIDDSNEKKSLSVDEEKMNLKMMNWHDSELNRLIDEHELEQKKQQFLNEQNAIPEMQNICEAMPGFSPPMPEMIDEAIIAEKMETLFSKQSGKADAKLEEKKTKSIKDEVMNQEMDKWCNNVIKTMIDDHKVDPEESAEVEKTLIRSFTITASNGTVVSGANMYFVYEDGTRKLLRTIAWELDKNGKMTKPFEGLVYLTDEFIEVGRYEFEIKRE